MTVPASLNTADLIVKVRTINRYFLISKPLRDFLFRSARFKIINCLKSYHFIHVCNHKSGENAFVINGLKKKKLN